MKRRIVSIAVALGLLVGLMVVPAQAATEEEIEEAIENGLVWLVAQQNADTTDPNFGSWTGANSREAGTGLALYKLCERAYELNDPDIESPFDPDYAYSQNVIDGFNWVFTHLSAIDISLQDHTTGASGTMDDPDSNGNGKGVRTAGYQIYGTGILLAAIAASGTPSRPNEGAMDVNQDTITDTYQEIAQDMVDFLAWGQVESPVPNITKEGGWDYSAVDNGAGGTGWKGDQSNSGYAVLGLAEAQAFGCTIPGWVKIELDWWIDWVQDDINDPVQTNDGGSWYSYPGDGIRVNILKTGNLIFQMALVGDTSATPRVIDALDYLERHWADASGGNQPPGWDGDPAHYQAMFCAMKGLEYMGIDTFGDPVIDWFEDFSDAIVAQQIPQDDTDPTIRGSWQTSSGRGEPVIITEWALLTLEKIAPEPEITEVPVDINPTSCPNPLNTKGNGVLPVAILGTEDFDVTQIDPASIALEGAAPLRWALEDVATPYEPFVGKEDCMDCTEEGPDGYQDLTLKFDMQEIVEALGEVEDGDCVVLHLTGTLKEEHGGTAIVGEDVVKIILKKGGKGKK